jgi:hypothetical protein
MDHVDGLAGLACRTFGVSEQLEQPHTSLQFKTALVVDGADDGNLSGMITLDEHINLWIPIKLEVPAGYFLRQLTFCLTGSLYLFINQRHANHAIAFNANRVT